MRVETVPKTGTDAVRPDTNAKWWQVIDERETEFVIEILEE